MKHARLSRAQIKALIGVRDHGDPGWFVRGRAAHGGAVRTVMSLRKRGLIVFGDSMWTLTASGVKALKEET